VLAQNRDVELNGGLMMQGIAVDPVELPDGDVVRILLEQHARVRDLFADLAEVAGADRQARFDELRELLAAHETAEELVLRPLSRDIAGDSVVDARNREEDEATRMLADLEKLDATSADFDRLLVQFEAAVLEHAAREEREEFPHVVAGHDEAERARLGAILRAAEALGPTHAHPSAAGSPVAQYALGPFASLLDRARDAVKRATSG
jgi:hemerythrin superfamily protein